MNRRARLALAAAALAAMAVSGCAGQPPADGGGGGADVPVSAAEPAPLGVTTVPAEPPEPPTQAAACDPTASLRPTGPLPPSGQMPPGSTMERILQRGRLIVGVDQSSYLFGFRDPFTGAIQGFDIDVIRQVAQAIFGDPNRVQYVVVSSADRVPVLQRGDVDLVASTLTITCDRARAVDFSTVYYDAGQRILVRRDSGFRGLDDLHGRPVCAAKGSTSIHHVAQAASHPVVVGVDDWGDCLVMLQQGQVDAISTDDAVLAGMVAQDPYTVVVGPRFTDEPYGVGVPKGAEDMVRFVNAVLDRMRADGGWQASYQHWLGAALGPAQPPPARYRD
ncbi:glutamate ABC transporter substrate-binding protein [Gandjariella thermophila]|uniref:glutamate ABC transporter substrate-binding protein n=1 Tax=Gandjariella thermophila TaxID=1931992 RepID=UPI001CEF58E2|nr:glutamate ABC transporter substrate-binding protein [Gandjariella thermophila]